MSKTNALPSTPVPASTSKLTGVIKKTMKGKKNLKNILLQETNASGAFKQPFTKGNVKGA